jgi:hypothetical protein
MFQRKPVHDVKKVVWRISEANPAGEWVSPTRPAAPRAPAGPETHDRWFRVSSLELAKGSEVTETDLNQLPGEFLDAFEKRR